AAARVAEFTGISRFALDLDYTMKLFPVTIQPDTMQFFVDRVELWMRNKVVEPGQVDFEGFECFQDLERSDIRVVSGQFGNHREERTHDRKLVVRIELFNKSCN